MLMMLESTLCVFSHLLWNSYIICSLVHVSMCVGDFVSSERKSRFMKWLSKLFKVGPSRGGGARCPQYLGDENMAWRAPPRSAVNYSVDTSSVYSGCPITVVSLSILLFTRNAIQLMTSKFQENSS